MAKLHGSSIEVGASGSRPGSPVAGSMFWNSSSLKLELYDGTNWLTVKEGFSASGGSESTAGGKKIHENVSRIRRKNALDRFAILKDTFVINFIIFC